MISTELPDRLMCAKYIFQTTARTLDQGIPYAAGLAVLDIHDSADMVLRVIAEHVHASLKDHMKFDDLLNSIDNAGATKLTHRSALSQLNKSRNNFKHSGLAPRDEDARKLRRDLDGFYPIATQAFLNIDFDALSLSPLIGHYSLRPTAASPDQKSLTGMRGFTRLSTSFSRYTGSSG